MSMVKSNAVAAPKAQQNALHRQISIVQAALALFLQQGYAATRMDTVAEQAGVTKQTVYRYYPSKEALFTAVMEKIRADEPPLYAFGEEGIEQELVRFGASLLAFHLRPAALGLYRILLSEGGDERLAQTFMQAGPNRVNLLLSDFLRQRCPRPADTAFYAQMFVSMILAPRNRLIMRGKGRISRAEQATHVNNVVRLFLNGLPQRP